MFELRFETVSVGITKYCILSEGGSLQFDQVTALWQHDVNFRLFFFEILSTSSYVAYRFETPPVSRHNYSRLFEFVLIDSPWLDVVQDQSPFAEHFEYTDAEVIEFDNLGADATLIVPCPLGSDTAYAHIAAFMRLAPESQKHMLWQMVGRCIMNKLSSQPIWLNTAGGGVDWLHIRLDSRPKYYAYRQYKVI